MFDYYHRINGAIVERVISGSLTAEEDKLLQQITANLAASPPFAE